MQAVRERSAGQVPLRTGSFYRHLGKLIDAGLVEETPRRPADADPRRGAHYRLTPGGRERFEQERRRMADLVALSGGLRRTPRKGQV
jgi:DNA-binding PadR family transcriptional regulator